MTKRLSPVTISHLLSVPALALVALAGFGCATASNPSLVIHETPSATVVAAPEVKPAPPVNVPPLKFVRADSEEVAADDNRGAKAVDGDLGTIWHTQWQDASPACPHEILFELTSPAAIKGFTYFPRQDDSENGTIKDYEFYVSNDGQDFGQPVAKGTFANSKEKKTVAFAPVTCHFIKLKALSEVNDAEWTSAAEIDVVPAN